MTPITHSNIDRVVHSDIRHHVKRALAVGFAIEAHWRKDTNGQPVETVVFDGERAGQARGGDAEWGDWDEKTQTIRFDDHPSERVGLNGEAVL